FFFVSSRRRHTRFSRDWSSDVCSSDLALGSIVFSDKERLSELNAIVHPAVKAETQRLFADAFAADPHAVVVYDVPLLKEARGTEIGRASCREEGSASERAAGARTKRRG